MQGPATMLLRVLLVIPLYMAIFAVAAGSDEKKQHSYSRGLKVLACAVLFASGNLLKTLLAKLLASHIHRKSFFDKMQDALQKVSCIPLRQE